MKPTRVALVNSGTSTSLFASLRCVSVRMISTGGFLNVAGTGCHFATVTRSTLWCAVSLRTQSGEGLGYYDTIVLHLDWLFVILRGTLVFGPLETKDETIASQ